VELREILLWFGNGQLHVLGGSLILKKSWFWIFWKKKRNYQFKLFQKPSRISSFHKRTVSSGSMKNKSKKKILIWRFFKPVGKCEYNQVITTGYVSIILRTIQTLLIIIFQNRKYWLLDIYIVHLIINKSFQRPMLKKFLKGTFVWNKIHNVG
jgi:hypothetical protein